MKFLDFFKKIEPLFRLIEVFLIAIVTIIVSINANLIARQANAIAEMQLDANKEENQPNFIIDQVLEPSRQGTENANSVLYIYNTGNTFYNPEIDIACILELNYIDNNPATVQYSFSIIDFYYISEMTSSTDGLLRKMYHEGNWETFYNVYRASLYDNRIDSGYIDLWQYVKISYDDIYGERHTNYYIVDEIRQRLISQDAGEQAFQQYNENLNKISVDALSLDELLQSIIEP